MISIKQLLSPYPSPEPGPRASNEKRKQELRPSEIHLAVSGSSSYEFVASRSPDCQATTPPRDQISIEGYGRSPVTPGKKESRSSESFAERRAAQNRAAQKAFRQRKEKLIQTLEERAQHCRVLNENCQSLQVENKQLRDYLVSLETRIMQVENEMPALQSDLLV